jgi:selenocysteine-specific elongation factor
VRLSQLHRIGVRTDPLPGQGAVVVGDWAVSTERLAGWQERLAIVVAEFEDSRPLERGMPLPAAAHAVGLPDPELMGALLRDPLRLADGRVTRRPSVVLPAPVRDALDQLRVGLETDPFGAPTADRLRELGLDAKATAAAAKAGLLLRLADGVVLMPGADRLALERLATLPQPFTTSEARQALGTSRRVALPLLGFLDRSGRTVRHPDDRRSVRGAG